MGPVQTRPHRHPAQHPNRIRHLSCPTTYTAHFSTGTSAQFSSGADNVVASRRAIDRHRHDDHEFETVPAADGADAAGAVVTSLALRTSLAALPVRQRQAVVLRFLGELSIDEVGYLPFEQDAANLVFQLVSSRYEHASLILTSNLPFSGWGGVFGDQAVAAAMIDRIVHHAEVLTLKGASYRLRNRAIDTLPSIRTESAT